ncbi:hypothetical protein SDC9_132197 [bioreactor metagenome]|uniref:Uncharacterized protein n=1 Tax=bioreactor metagenome TaxID=1076179 RepID=A0A645D6H5_9ZZZZ
MAGRMPLEAADFAADADIAEVRVSAQQGGDVFVEFADAEHRCKRLLHFIAPSRRFMCV